MKLSPVVVKPLPMSDVSCRKCFMRFGSAESPRYLGEVPYHPSCADRKLREDEEKKKKLLEEEKGHHPQHIPAFIPSSDLSN